MVKVLAVAGAAVGVGVLACGVYVLGFLADAMDRAEASLDREGW